MINWFNIDCDFEYYMNTSNSRDNYPVILAVKDKDGNQMLAVLDSTEVDNLRNFLTIALEGLSSKATK